MKKLKGFEIQNSIEEKCWKLSSYVLSQYDFQSLTHPVNEYWCIFENRFKDSFETIFFKELIEKNSPRLCLVGKEESLKT